ncbi:MAG: (deoxy)nucleoside triphosphate pyrophosphohydrolase [Clostridia bacterium]|nr:(deoxy)nucleoside triphosphate pyrophosphohydrolase [Clostridia bacterium]
MTEFEERYGKVVQVVAALIWDENREKFLACQRPAHKSRGLMWEFVGGKQEKGETLEEALVRECKEELAVNIGVDDVFMELDHVYPDLTIHLTLFNCKIVSGEIKMLEHNDIKWMTPAETDNYTFCPADKDILEELKKL